MVCSMQEPRGTSQRSRALAGPCAVVSRPLVGSNVFIILVLQRTGEMWSGRDSEGARARAPTQSGSKTQRTNA